MGVHALSSSVFFVFPVPVMTPNVWYWYVFSSYITAKRKHNCEQCLMFFKRTFPYSYKYLPKWHVFLWLNFLLTQRRAYLRYQASCDLTQKLSCPQTLRLFRELFTNFTLFLLKRARNEQFFHEFSGKYISSFVWTI